MIVESVFLASEHESMKHINTSTSDKYIKFCFVLFFKLNAIQTQFMLKPKMRKCIKCGAGKQNHVNHICYS